MALRTLLMTPTAIRARERRFDAMLRREEAKMNAEVRILMNKGMSFDQAWVASGGAIYSDQELAKIARSRI